MDARSHIIIDELQSLQSPLASWPAVTPFQVPQNYFQTFPDHLKLILEAETAPDLMPLFGRLKTPFAVSQSYFINLRSEISEAIEAEEIADTFSRQPVFEVPPGYFEGLAGSVMAAIGQDSESELSGFSRTNVFSVPDGYFASLTDSVMASVIQEADEVTLNLPVADPFTVPEGYFDQFAAQIHTRITASEGFKTIPLRPRRMIPIQVARWAAAAALVVGIFTGIRNAGTPQTASVITQRALAAVPSSVLQDYIAQHMDDFDLDLIEARLPSSTFQSTTPASRLNTNEIRSFLAEEELL
jgi:flagellar assembly factor FliW